MSRGGKIIVQGFILIVCAALVLFMIQFGSAISLPNWLTVPLVIATVLLAAAGCAEIQMMSVPKKVDESIIDQI